MERCVHDGHLKVFNHHVYEYRKGLRHLALQTLPSEHEVWVTSRLARLGIAHVVYPAGTRHINVFLGDGACLEVIRRIGKTDLSHFTPEEDFMLGIMLGYDRRQQYARYLALVQQDGGTQAHSPDEGEDGLQGLPTCSCRDHGRDPGIGAEGGFPIAREESVIESEVYSC
jgi:hypothetical protein